MGYKYEVCAWEWRSSKDWIPLNTNGWILQYEGNSIIYAIVALIKAKYKGYGCVKLEWR